jgi:hypothetical protein
VWSGRDVSLNLAVRWLAPKEFDFERLLFANTIPHDLPAARSLDGRNTLVLTGIEIVLELILLVSAVRLLSAHFRVCE